MAEAVSAKHAPQQCVNENSGRFDIRNRLVKEGLTDIAHLGFADQVLYLLEERRFLQQELDNVFRVHFYNQRLNPAKIQSMLEKQRDDYETQLRDQHLAMQHVKEQLDKSHQGEISLLNKEKSDALKELNVAKDKIQYLQDILEGKAELEADCTCIQKVRQLREQRAHMQSQLTQQQRLIIQLKEKITVLEKLNKQIELDNETLSYKLSEVLAQYDDLEEQLRKAKLNNRRNSAIFHQSSVESPSKFGTLHSRLENSISATQHELSLISQIKSLQLQSSKLQEDLLVSAQKNQILLNKYQQRKARHRDRLVKIKQDLAEQTMAWQNRLDELSRNLKIAEEALDREATEKTQLEINSRQLKEEKQQLLNRLNEAAPEAPQVDLNAPE